MMISLKSPKTWSQGSGSQGASAGSWALRNPGDTSGNTRRLRAGADEDEDEDEASEGVPR